MLLLHFYEKGRDKNTVGNQIPLERVDVNRWRIPRRYNSEMRVPGMVSAIPEQYRAIGQPVLIPGDMGRYSFVLVGAQGSMEQSFGTCCHGASRRLSRTAARKAMDSKNLPKYLDRQGVTVRVPSKNLLTEEAPQAYKDAQQVVDIVHNAGLANLVVRLKPIIVVKG
jgi:tRNA-splicing ligase RtcB